MGDESGNFRFLQLSGYAEDDLQDLNAFMQFAFSDNENRDIFQKFEPVRQAGAWL